MPSNESGCHPAASGVNPRSGGISYRTMVLRTLPMLFSGGGVDPYGVGAALSNGDEWPGPFATESTTRGSDSK